MTPRRSDPPRPPGTPDEVVITWEARRPEVDPTLGIPVVVDSREPCPNRLVTVGDSITAGFQSGAIYHTALSWPALVARELGWSGFRFPTYDGFGGLPLNLEFLLRELEGQFGEIGWLDSLPALAWVNHYLNRVEQWWEVDADQTYRPAPGLTHNLAVHGFKLRDASTRTLAAVEEAILKRRDHWRLPLPEGDVDRAARRVLANADLDMAVLDVARAFGDDGDPGIEVLVVALGANHALGSVVQLRYRWTDDRYPDDPDGGGYTVWTPTHFAADWAELIRRVEEIRARHVVVATVPHVTIAPIARGVATADRGASRYYPYYTKPWITDADFDPDDDPTLTGDQARAIDSAVDQYNTLITDTVRRARSQGRDWYLFDLCGLLDRLAYKRYLTYPEAKASWWDDVGGAYPLPGPLTRLDPVPDTRFFQSDAGGRSAGGLFSLDGAHPTTIGYGIVAQEVIRILEVAAVPFFEADGRTGRPHPVQLDFAALLGADSLLRDPPRSLSHTLRVLGWLDDKADTFRSLLGP